MPTGTLFFYPINYSPDERRGLYETRTDAFIFRREQSESASRISARREAKTLDRGKKYTSNKGVYTARNSFDEYKKEHKRADFKKACKHSASRVLFFLFYIKSRTLSDA